MMRADWQTSALTIADMHASLLIQGVLGILNHERHHMSFYMGSSHNYSLMNWDTR